MPIPCPKCGLPSVASNGLGEAVCLGCGARLHVCTSPEAAALDEAFAGPGRMAPLDLAPAVAPADAAPLDAHGHNLRGVAFANRGDRQQALDKFTQALRPS